MDTNTPSVPAPWRGFDPTLLLILALLLLSLLSFIAGGHSWLSDRCVTNCPSSVKPPPVVVVKQTVHSHTLDEATYFAFNDSTLSLTGQTEIDKLLSSPQVKAMKAKRIVLEGFADPIDSDNYNCALSLQRTESVKKHLLSKKLAVAAEVVQVAQGERKNDLPLVASCKARYGPTKTSKGPSEDLKRCFQPLRKVMLEIDGVDFVSNDVPFAPVSAVPTQLCPSSNPTSKGGTK